MSNNVVQKVDDLAGVIGVDQLRQDKLLNKLIPADAEPLTGKVLVMSGTSKKTGYLASDAAAAYKAGAGAGASVSYLINDPTFTLSTPDTTTSVNAGDLGLLKLRVNGVFVDSFDLAAAFDVSKEGAAQNYTPANSPLAKITVLSVEMYERVWQKLTARVNIAAADLRKGYNSIELVHTDTMQGEQVSATYEVFYDDAPAIPLMQAVSLAIHGAVTRPLSGVNYLAQNAVVKVGTVVDNLVNNSYVGNAIQFSDLRGAPVTTLPVTDGSISGISNPPVVGETATLTDKLITLSVSNECSKDGRITGLPRDPFGSYATVTSASQNLLISTFSNASTPSQEYFADEVYRLPLSWNEDDKTSQITGNWDSNALLAAGNAQQYISGDNQHALVYPSINFSNGFSPANTANYAGFSGPVKYLRAEQTSSAKSSIQLILEGVSAGVGQLGSSDINVEIRLPGETGWLDCAKPYNGTSTGEGDGCMVGGISYAGGKATINATFGTKSSFGSNNRCYVRITLNNGSRVIHSIKTNW